MFCWLTAYNTFAQGTVTFTGDTIVQVNKKTVKEKKQRVLSPHKATLLSAVLPGMGQAYNHKYWKIPILYAGIGGISYAIGFNSKWYRKYKAAYRDFIIQDPNNKSYLEFLPPTWTEEDLYDPMNASWFQSALSNKKDYYRRYRDLSFIGMAIVYVLNLMDASVDAHLSTFDISDDLSFKLDPVIIDPTPANNSGAGIKLSINF